MPCCFEKTYNRRLFLFVVIASLPLMAAGLAVATFVPDAWLLNPMVVATATLVFGLVLLFADIGFGSRRAAKDITVVDALVFGLMAVPCAHPRNITVGHYNDRWSNAVHQSD